MAIKFAKRMEVLKASEIRELLKLTDVLIDGKFVQELKSEKAKFRGSTNQRAIDVKKSLKEGYVCEHIF